jgi:ribonuclease VapC
MAPVISILKASVIGTDDTEKNGKSMYFDGTTLTALLSDAEQAAANAPGIAADVRAQTSPLAVIEAAVELPELGEAGVTAFLDTHRIELRDMPPRHRLVEDALASEGKLKERLHAACAAYYETDMAVLPLPVPAAPQADTPQADTPQADTPQAQ